MQHKLNPSWIALGVLGLGVVADVAAAPPAPATAVAKAAVATVSKVSVESVAGGVRIRIEGTGDLAPVLQAMKRPTPANLITIPARWTGPRRGYRRVRENGVTIVRYGQFDKGHVRVVVNTRRPLSARVVPGAVAGVVEVLVGATDAAATSIAATPTQPANVAPKPEPKAIPATPIVRPVPATPAVQVKPAVKPVPLSPATPSPVVPKPIPVERGNPVEAPVRPAPVVEAPKPPAVPSTPEEVGSKKVSLDFVASDITDVLKALSLQSGVNIVAGSSVTGKVTLSLKNVLLREALDWVTRLSGFRYIQQGSTFVVGTGKEVALLARTSQIGNAASAAVAFYYADGASLLMSLQSLFPNVNVSLVNINPEAKRQDMPAGAIPGAPGLIPGGPESLGLNNPTPRGGVVNVVGSSDEVSAVRKFIEDIEKSMVDAADRDIEARAARVAGHRNEIVTVRYVNPSELIGLLKDQVPTVSIKLGPQQRMVGQPGGGSITFGGGAGGAVGGGALGGIGGGSTGATGLGAGGFGGGAGGQGGAFGAGANGQGGTSSADTLLLSGPAEDVARARALIEKLDHRAPQFVFEAEVFDVNSDDVDTFGLTYDLTKTVTIGELSGGADTTQQPRNMGFGAILRTPYTLGAQLQALVKANKAKVLARPKLVGQDNIPAMAFIGDQFNYVVNIQQTPQGQNVTTGTATVGITLRVTGKSNGDGSITLYVHPEVSTITSFLTVGNFALPQTSTRFVDTTIRVKDGEMIAIGGLVRSEEFFNKQSVPFLGQLPVIGKLFSSTTKQKRKSEVMVFLTARIAKD
ncbi:MAG: hypothetical protein ACKO5K_16245 [Armatimonadota bacterium]